MKNISINIDKKIFINPKEKNLSHLAINKFKLFIPKGEFCSIIGPSGCGKTTLLNLISGLDNSLKGSISFNKNQSVSSAKLAYMFQTPRLLPWLNVLENVEIVLSSEQKKMSISKDILSIMGLEKFINYYPNKLSGGMQRSVALARSFATEPELLILDEPFISLDEPIAEMLREMLIKLWTKQPTTIIFVTRDLNEAIYLSDRVVFLSKAPAKVIKEVKINFARPRGFKSKKITEIKNKIISENKFILKGEL